MNSELSKWKNDKIYQYWKKSFMNKPKQRTIENSIKIKGINHEGFYLIDETTNKNGKIYYKQYKLTKKQLEKYIDRKKNNYRIQSFKAEKEINDTYSDNDSVFNEENNLYQHNHNFIHREYSNHFNLWPINSYRNSLNK